MCVCLWESGCIGVCLWESVSVRVGVRVSVFECERVVLGRRGLTLLCASLLVFLLARA